MGEEAFSCFWVVEGFECAVEEEGGDVEAKVIGCDVWDGMGFVEDEEVVGEEDALGDIFWGRG